MCLKIKEQEYSSSSSDSSTSPTIDSRALSRSRSDSHMRKSPTGDIEKDKRATRALKVGLYYIVRLTLSFS